MTEGTEKNVQNYRRDKINELAHKLVIAHLNPNGIEESTIYEDDRVWDLGQELDDPDVWQDIAVEVESVLDVLLQRYLDEQPLDLTLSNRLNEEN